MTEMRTDEEAWAMALENEGLANKLCRQVIDRGTPRGIDFEWLKSVAWEGLFRAAKQYDAEVARFSTFAMLVMRNEVIREMRRHDAAQGGPRSSGYKDRVAWVNSIEEDSQHLARNTNTPDDPVEPQYLAAEDPGFDEVDERLSDESGIWMDRLAEVTDGLPEHHKAWIRRRLDGERFTDIAADYGVSRQAVQNVFLRAIEPLREYAEASA